MAEISKIIKDKNEVRIHKGLERSYKLAIENKNELKVNIKQAKIIIFSDHHKGKRDGADDFMRCEKAYSAALGYYLEAGYTLIIQGDSEELWECKPKGVVNSYRDVLLLEAEFHKSGRYVKISGNHDDYWESPAGIKKYLEPIFGSPLKIIENLRLLFETQQSSCEVFLVHGHQGDFLSDKNAKISKFLVRYLWRPFQRITKIKLTTPAKNYKLRDTHSKAMYSWAEKKKNLVLIAGHTHIPVFEMRRSVEKLEEKLKKTTAKKNLKETSELRSRIEFMKAQERMHKSDGFSLSKPYYFNTGCCSFSDGDVTGIEISDGQIKLVRWPDDAGGPGSKTLAQSELKDVFSGIRS